MCHARSERACARVDSWHFGVYRGGPVARGGLSGQRGAAGREGCALRCCVRRADAEAVPGARAGWGARAGCCCCAHAGAHLRGKRRSVSLVSVTSMKKAACLVGGLQLPQAHARELRHAAMHEIVIRDCTPLNEKLPTGPPVDPSVSNGAVSAGLRPLIAPAQSNIILISDT